MKEIKDLWTLIFAFAVEAGLTGLFLLHFREGGRGLLGIPGVCFGLRRVFFENGGKV
jgi:hypothetical protein